MQLRPVAAFHPSELDCYRYRNSKAPVDFLAVVNPAVRGSGGCWVEAGAGGCALGPHVEGAGSLIGRGGRACCLSRPQRMWVAESVAACACSAASATCAFKQCMFKQRSPIQLLQWSHTEPSRRAAWASISNPTH